MLPMALSDSAMVDEDYMLVAGHVDEAICRHIIQGEYVDFARLIPCDCVQDDENCMEMVNQGGGPDLLGTSCG